MKVLAIVASGRRSGNINNICEKVIEGARNVGHEVELINLYDYNVKHCIGCLECTKTRKCVLKDDFETIYNKEKDADVIVIGTPIYCHSVPGILKDFIDRSCYAVTPFVDVAPNESYFGKLGLVRKYLNGFKINAPFKTKRFITILSCSNPSKYSSDIKEASSLMKKYTEEMGSKIIKSIKCTDTLFKLKPKTIEKIYQEAFLIGSCIK